MDVLRIVPCVKTLKIYLQRSQNKQSHVKRQQLFFFLKVFLLLFDKKTRAFSFLQLALSRLNGEYRFRIVAQGRVFLFKFFQGLYKCLKETSLKQLITTRISVLSFFCVVRRVKKVRKNTETQKLKHIVSKARVLAYGVFFG